jgi:deoxyadenosine/deoxycytidine kinase
MSRIGIVGVCASGKTTLATALREQGFDARQVSQEHSYVPDLWRRFSHCDVLIYLDISLETLRRRREAPNWPSDLYEEQRRRLQTAREHCDVYLNTDPLSPGDVLAQVLAALENLGESPGPTVDRGT